MVSAWFLEKRCPNFGQRSTTNKVTGVFGEGIAIADPTIALTALPATETF